MSKKYFSELTPLEKAEQGAYNFAFKMYEALLINAYMTSGGLESPPSANVSDYFPSGSQTSSKHQAA